MNRSFTIVSIVVFLAQLLSSLTWGEAPPSQVAVSIIAKGDIWVGQKVTLSVDLLAPGYFVGVPKFDFPTIPGVLLVPPEDHPTLGTKQIDGQSFTIQHYEVLLFAKRPGTFEIPSFQIRFGIKRAPLDPEASPQSVLTSSVSFTAKMPPGAENLTSLISARDLTVESKWSPVPHACKVGDAFTRTITYIAADVPGMAFPPFPVTQIDGLGVYPKAPIVSDQSERGELRGSRQDAITYVCERPGRFVVPAAKLTWWNTDDQSLHTIDFPEQVFEATSNPAFAHQAAHENRRFVRIAKWATCICALAVTPMHALSLVSMGGLPESLQFSTSHPPKSPESSFAP